MLAKRIAAGLFLLFVIGVIAVTVIAVLEPQKLFGVDEDRFASSLADEAGFGGGGTCRPEPDGSYACGVEVDPGSGVGRSYLLTETEEDGCWRAVQVSFRRAKDSGEATSEPRPGTALEGCVSLDDYVLPDTIGD